MFLRAQASFIVESMLQVVYVQYTVWYDVLPDTKELVRKTYETYRVFEIKYHDRNGTVSESDTHIIQLDTVDFDYLFNNQLTFAMQQILELNKLNAEKIKGFVVATVCLKNEKLADYYYHRSGEKMKYTFPTIDEIALDIKNLSKDVALYSNKIMNANNYN